MFFSRPDITNMSIEKSDLPGMMDVGTLCHRQAQSLPLINGFGNSRREVVSDTGNLCLRHMLLKAYAHCTSRGDAYTLEIGDSLYGVCR
jgi:hypothetical protein